MHHLISGINSVIHLVSHVLICLLLTHHTSMIISPRQRHHHHSCHPSPHYSFIPIWKLFFFSNLFLHSHLAPLRTDSTVIRTCSRFLCLLFSFFLSFSFHYYSSFLTFSVFFLILVVFTSFIFRILSVLHLGLRLFLFSVSLISFFF